MGKSRKNQRRRDVSTISNRRLPTLPTQTLKTPDYLKPLSLLQELEDRRQFHPEGRQRPARGFRNARHRLTEHKTITRRQQPNKKFKTVPTGLQQTTHRIGFEQPEQIAVCVRRKKREEILHALKKTGKTGQKRPRRSYYSSISCKGKK